MKILHYSDVNCLRKLTCKVGSYRLREYRLLTPYDMAVRKFIQHGNHSLAEFCSLIGMCLS